MKARDNSNVFPVAALDPEHAAQFKQPWGFECDEFIAEFATEDAACEAQRIYRLARGFNPITGERALWS